MFVKYLGENKSLNHTHVCVHSYACIYVFLCVGGVCICVCMHFSKPKCLPVHTQHRILLPKCLLFYMVKLITGFCLFSFFTIETEGLHLKKDSATRIDQEWQKSSRVKWQFQITQRTGPRTHLVTHSWSTGVTDPARQVWAEALSPVCAHTQRAVLSKWLPVPTGPPKPHWGPDWEPGPALLPWKACTVLGALVLQCPT